MAFQFHKNVDPYHPVDSRSPPPVGWEGIDPQQLKRRACSNDPFMTIANKCWEWEREELGRIEEMKKEGAP